MAHIQNFERKKPQSLVGDYQDCGFWIYIELFRNSKYDKNLGER